ncbi:protein PLASTID REDOX INSENSITIVE 2, chloroplastic [Rutidosis leptorrhynchoides]|uniref:protein PLASTID REDOX INSENSITIVE 2, chloroplastic n=1 Tax=Rutidosis leptorrhynchoides TaxID=125765 RepID=UPI003A99EDB3
MASASSLIISSTVPFSFSSSLNYVSIPILRYQITTSYKRSNLHKSSFRFSINPLGRNPKILVVKAAEYKFPDPIPEFAESETEKFRDHLIEKLSKKDVFEESLDEVVDICTEIFAKFMNEEYGGPGTLMVDPFWEMADTINESELPGGPQAARAAVKWAQDHVDKDWKEWNGE